MIGLPTETEGETRSTIAMAKDLTKSNKGFFRASIFVFRPYPGTQEWNYLTNLGCTPDSLLSMHATGQGDRSKHGVLTTQKYAELEPEELQQLLDDYNVCQAGLLNE